MPWIETVPQPRATLAANAQPQQPRAWYKISAVADDEAEILVYDEIGGWFGGGAEDFVRELRDVSASRLTVRVNSPGGSVFDGVTIANALRGHPSTVTVKVDGIAASIASVIALAGDQLVMMPQSQLMIHDASGLSIGNAADMRQMAELLDRQSDNIAEAYADKAGGTVDEWRERMRAETWYSAKEAVDAGLADELVQMPQRKPEDEPAAALLAATWDLSVFRYAGREQAPPPPIPTASTEPEPTTASSTTLTFNIGSGLDDGLVAVLRGLVAAHDTAPDPADTAVPKHSTETTEGEWNGPAQEKNLPSPVPVATAKKVYAWYDATQVEDGNVPKSACKLPHHQVSSDGTPGAAVMAGVRNALARLPQTKGIPESEKAAIEAHLNAHLKAGGGEPGDRAAAEPTAVAEPVPAPEPAAPAAPATPAQPDVAPEPDGWADQTAHLLTEPATDDWAILMAQLTEPSPAPSSSAATA